MDIAEDERAGGVVLVGSLYHDGQRMGEGCTPILLHHAGEGLLGWRGLSRRVAVGPHPLSRRRAGKGKGGFGLGSIGKTE
ncbi:hypothetical protein [Parabacteroides sp.]